MKLDQFSERQINHLNEFHPYIGHKKVMGEEMPRTRAELVRHVFIVKKRDCSTAAWHPITGNNIMSFIMTDEYDIVYAGNQAIDTKGVAMDPSLQENLKPYLDKQEGDLVEGFNRKYGHMGIVKDSETAKKAKKPVKKLEKRAS